MNRRTFIRVAGGWIALGPTLPHVLGGARSAVAQPWGPGAVPTPRSSPINRLIDLDDNVLIDGVPFWRSFSGNRFANPNQHPPFPLLGEWIGYGNAPPLPTENADIVVVGGGLAGLAAAHMLRDHNPLVLEHNSRFGGHAQAEQWGDLPFSIAGAYCIEPDEPIASLYKELGLDRLARITPGPPNADPIEVNGKLIENFWFGAGQTPDVAQQFLDFVALVQDYGENYPDIPLPDKDADWIIDLDRVTLKHDIESRLGPLPPILEAAIQHYCWSSFGAGWEHLSAAGGWNFLAAEQFGQWVFPGGTAQLAQKLWEALLASGGRERLRAEKVVLDVRPYKRDVLVTYGNIDGSVRSIRAKRVVMACPKFVCKTTMPEYLKNDVDRVNSILQIENRAYIVVNVLLTTGVPDSFYDAFFLQDGTLPPPDAHDAVLRDWARPLDVVSAGWTLGGTKDHAALTFYFPLTYATGLAWINGDAAFTNVANQFLPHMDHILGAIGFDRRHIRQVRMTRWGHALPVSAPNLIAHGHVQRARAPIDNNVFFVNQDNWALPAVETSLLEAFHFAPRIAAGL